MRKASGGNRFFMLRKTISATSLRRKHEQRFS